MTKDNKVVTIGNHAAKQLAATIHNQSMAACSNLEDRLQSKMFLQLQADGMLTCKKIGSYLDLKCRGSLLARVIYMELADAVTCANTMNTYFKANKMFAWEASIHDCEMY